MYHLDISSELWENEVMKQETIYRVYFQRDGFLRFEEYFDMKDSAEAESLFKRNYPLSKFIRVEELTDWEM